MFKYSSYTILIMPNTQTTNKNYASLLLSIIISSLILASSIIFINLVSNDPSQFSTAVYLGVVFGSGLIACTMVIGIRVGTDDDKKTCTISIIILLCAWFVTIVFMIFAIPFLDDCKNLSSISDISVDECMNLVSLEKIQTGQEILDVYESKLDINDISRYEILDRNLAP